MKSRFLIQISLKTPFKDIQDIVIEFSPDIIGISLRNIDSTNKRRVVFYYDYLKKTLDVVKALSNAKIIIGGSGFSMFAKEIMKDEPRIDFGIFLEGEITFQSFSRTSIGRKRLNPPL